MIKSMTERIEMLQLRDEEYCKKCGETVCNCNYELPAGSVHDICVDCGNDTEYCICKDLIFMTEHD